jgi:hypothetical protein
MTLNGMHDNPLHVGSSARRGNHVEHPHFDGLAVALFQIGFRHHDHTDAPELVGQQPHHVLVGAIGKLRLTKNERVGSSPQAPSGFLQTGTPAHVQRPTLNRTFNYSAILSGADRQHTPSHRHIGSPVLRLPGKAGFGLPFSSWTCIDSAGVAPGERFTCPHLNNPLRALTEITRRRLCRWQLLTNQVIAVVCARRSLTDRARARQSNDLHDAVSHGVANEIRHRVQIQLPHHIGAVGLRGFHTEVEYHCNFLAGLALCQ